MYKAILKGNDIVEVQSADGTANANKEAQRLFSLQYFINVKEILCN